MVVTTEPQPNGHCRVFRFPGSPESGFRYQHDHQANQLTASVNTCTFMGHTRHSLTISPCTLVRRRWMPLW